MTGKLSVSGDVLIRLERAAMIHFGVPSFGAHLNGYVKASGEPVETPPPVDPVLVFSFHGPYSSSGFAPAV